MTTESMPTIWLLRTHPQLPPVVESVIRQRLAELMKGEPQ